VRGHGDTLATLCRMPVRIAALAAAAAVLLAVAGCGGSDESSVETIATTTDEQAEATPSRREFIASADARCREANVAIANLGSTAGENLVLVARQEREITRGVSTDIEDMEGPESSSGSLERYLDALQDATRVLREREQAARSGETEAYEALAGELAQAKADARIAAEEYGFESCGQEGEELAGEDSGDGGDPGEAAPGDPSGPAPAPAPAPAPSPAPAPAAPAPSAPAPDPSGGTGAGGGSGSGSDGGGSGGGSGGISP
jgi:hypothetical protein